MRRLSLSRRTAVAITLCLLGFGSLPPAAAAPPLPTSCAIPTVDDQCEVWVSAYSTGVASTASGYPHFLNEQVMAISPDGANVFVTGIELPGTIVTAAYSAETGQQLWAARYNGTPAYPYSTPESLSISPDGRNVYVVGIVQESIGMCAGNNFYSNNHGTSVVLAYDAATGAPSWSGPADPGAPAGTLATCSLSAAVSPDGSQIYTTGWSYEDRPEGLTIGAVTTALDSASGVLLWRRAHTDPTGPTRAPRLALSPDGSRLYVVGSTFTDQGVKANVQAYDVADAGPDGPELAWAENYSANGFWLPDLDVSPEGNRVVVIQHRSDPSDGFAAWLEVTAHDATDGSVLWSHTVTGPGNPVQTDYTWGWHHYQPMAFSPDGGTVYVTGNVVPRKGAGGTYTQHPGGFITAAIDLDSGTRRWTSVYRLPTGFGSVLGTAITASPDGTQLYVTGMSELGPSPTGIVYRTHAASTVAYDASAGTQLWVGLDLDHPGLTDSVVVSPDGGRVFVAGDGAMDPSSQRFSMAVRSYDAEASTIGES